MFKKIGIKMRDDDQYESNILFSNNKNTMKNCSAPLRCNVHCERGRKRDSREREREKEIGLTHVKYLLNAFLNNIPHIN